MNYNRSQIMKSAWRTFKMKSNSKSFGECLKSAWMLEKMSVAMDNLNDANKAKRAKANEAWKSEKANRTVNSYSIPEGYNPTASRGGLFNTSDSRGNLYIGD